MVGLKRGGDEGDAQVSGSGNWMVMMTPFTEKEEEQQG